MRAHSRHLVTCIVPTFYPCHPYFQIGAATGITGAT
jgi:hypothetical protein